MRNSFLAVAQLAIFLLLLTPHDSVCQPKVDPGHLHERWICVVPMTGTGSYDDPRRPDLPLFEWRDEDGTPESLDLPSFSYQLSDDGQFALVELAARNRETLRSLLPWIPSGARIFEQGKFKRADLIRELRKFKRDFLPHSWGVRLP